MIYRASCALCGEVVIRADESVPAYDRAADILAMHLPLPGLPPRHRWPIPAGASHLLVAGGAQVTRRDRARSGLRDHHRPRLIGNCSLTTSSTSTSCSPAMPGSTSSSRAGTAPTRIAPAGSAAESGSASQRTQQVAASRDAGTGRARTQPAVPVVFGVPPALGVAALAGCDRGVQLCASHSHVGAHEARQDSYGPRGRRRRCRGRRGSPPRVPTSRFRQSWPQRTPWWCARRLAVPLWPSSTCPGRPRTRWSGSQVLHALQSLLPSKA